MLEQQLWEKQGEIESWFDRQWALSPPPFYASVDLRNAGFKLAPVDTNLFPGGFNNLDADFWPLCQQALLSALNRLPPLTRQILIIPENHTRNLFYLESVAVLCDLLQSVGLSVRIGMIAKEEAIADTITLPSGKSLPIAPLKRQNNRVGVERFFPDLILLNNDLIEGHPEILQSLDQRLIPPASLGWYKRLKSEHFSHYHQVAEEFAMRFGIDPWLIEPYFRHCGQINFLKRKGEECLASYVDELLARIQRKYREYDIQEPPFVVVKADAGTYGMAIMSVRDASEIHNLSRKRRTRMAANKGGVAVQQVIIQEGVPTHEVWGEKPSVAEPVLYLIDQWTVGGFYRVHAQRGIHDNLNAPGMHFVPMNFKESMFHPGHHGKMDLPNRFHAYGIIARLALLAAAREILTLEKEQNRSLSTLANP